MEEKKCYLYGAEIKLEMEISDAEYGWAWMASRAYDNLMKSVEEYVIDYYGKILCHGIERIRNEITIRMLSGREDIINDVAGIVEEQVGVKGKIYKFQIRSPLPSENKI